jgi:DNA-binding FadR family transcriptional regulator
MSVKKLAPEAPGKPVRSMLGAPQQIRTPKAAELVAKRLRNSIIRGELKAGHALPGEVALMAHFQVSRQTLREALRVLESESLLSITRGAHGGPRVLSPDPNLETIGKVILRRHSFDRLVDVLE